MQARLFNFMSADFRPILLRNICLGRCSLETHYDVLKLPRDCTAQEIRNSFIKLSKQYHPDKNTNDDNRHALFVRLNEAYTVLSRPDTRRGYDLSLVPNRPAASTYSQEIYEAHQKRPFKDPTFYANRDKGKMDFNKPYYGIKGVQRLSNVWIMILCLIFAAVGVGLQVGLIRESVTFSRKIIDEQSKQNALKLTLVRKNAAREGNEAIFKRMELSAEKYEVSKKED